MGFVRSAEGGRAAASLLIHSCKQSNMTEQREAVDLAQSTKEKVQKFNRMRGVQVKEGEFWDLVLISAADDLQKAAYELQLREKIQRKELPIGPRYDVIADPPGNKIGNGGSTLHILQQLRQRHPEALSSSRILLIHAGGLSQRLPHASALGKIFTALPLGRPLYQMLELKLLIYVDFPGHMKPGVLVTCADDIELYSANQSAIFSHPGFTALAHPSPLSVGTTHGVFVLNAQEAPPTGDLEYRTCWRFLHKPSIEAMRQSGAVFLREGQETIYTDSTYYMDHSTVESMLDLWNKIGPLTCEIDAYGDFLQSLGGGATPEYTSNTANVVRTQTELVWVREKIFQHLRGTPLNLIVLNHSKFYHLGTMEEYLYHLTADPLLRGQLGFLATAFSSAHMENSQQIRCIMHSVLHPSVRLDEGSVVEYSRMEAGVTVGPRSIVSSCWVSEGLSVPSETFVHSLAVRVDGRLGFVTIACGVQDDLKWAVPEATHLNSLQIFGIPLGECVRRWGLCADLLRFSGGTGMRNLWTCCLFPVCEDLKTSFSVTLQMVRVLRGDEKVTWFERSKRLSLQEVLQNKDLQTMLDFRGELYQDIHQEPR